MSQRYWVCKACANRHTLTGRFEAWPDWAKALKCSEEAERRYDKVEAEQRIVPLDAPDELLQSSHSPLNTRMDCLGGLPLSPYDTPTENSAYRRSHGLPDVPEP